MSAMLLFLSLASVNDAELETLAAAVADARATVDALSADIDVLRSEAREEQLAFSRRKTSLESDLDVARLKRTELELRISALEEAQAKRGAQSERLAAPIRTAVAALRAHVVGGVPFKLKDRGAALDDIERALAADGAARAIELITAFIDSELDLARTNARVRQPVTVEGKKVMAEVIRLGRVAMIFRTKDGEVGYAGRGADTWLLFEDPADRARVSSLFEAMARPAATGVVLIPRIAFERAEAK